MRILILFILALMAATSFSFARSGDKMHGKLLAKASIKTSAAQIMKYKGQFSGIFIGSQSRDGETNYRAELNTDPFDPASTGESGDSDDVYLAIINDLKSETNPDLGYQSPSLKAEDLPLVMSSADKKTTSVVIPPFLYFKTQF